MELIKSGRPLSNCFSYYCKSTNYRNTLKCSINQLTIVRTFAARKGYREAAQKKKVKTVIQKQAWIPHNLRKRDNKETINSLRSFEHRKAKAFNDVYLNGSYTMRVFDFKDAVNCLRESHHPTMYNVPDAQLNVYLELDMTTSKPTRFVEKFSRMAILPHVFHQDGLIERTIMVFCKTQEQKDEAQDAGASLVGGVEVIKEIERGKIVLPDYRFVIAHPTILPEMVTIRGLLKKKFPTVKSGTLGPNLGELVTQFKNGVEYSCIKDEKVVDFGLINTSVGRLNMEDEQLEENFQALLDDINKSKPNRPGQFVTRVLMSTPYTVQGPFIERYKINLTPFLVEEDEGGDSSDEDEPVAAKQ